MRVIIFLFFFFSIAKSATNAQTPQEVQQQMKDAVNDLKKQIADQEKQIADAKKNKEDAETIKGMEDELAQLKQQLAMMEKMGKTVASIPTSMMDKASKQVMAETDNSTVRIPERKTALLNALPKDELTKVELQNFLINLHNDLKKKLPEQFADVQKIITVLKNDAAQIAYTGVSAWYSESPAQAALLLTYAASKSPGDANTLNNCGAILNLCGKEEKAIPILKYVLISHPDNSTVLNNLGQAYTGLGDRATAMMYFGRCMQQSPGHPEACATASYIEAERGNTAEATRLMSQALKNGYTDARVKFIDNINPGRSSAYFNMSGIDLKNDYYMRGNFTLAPNCRSWKNCEDIYEAQQVLWKKLDALEQRYTNVVLQNSMPIITGEVSPWNEAIYFKIKQISDDYLYRRGQDGEVLMAQTKQIIENTAAEMKALDARFEPQYKACEGKGGDCATKVSFRHCQERTALEDRYHSAMADVAENFQNTWYPQDLEFHNKIIWLMSLRSTDDKFLLAESATQTINLLHQIKVYTLSICDPAGKPNCEQFNPSNPQNASSAEFKDAQCPINLKIPFGAGKVSLSCKSFGIEVGQGVKFGYEKNFITKESTLSMGVGVDADIPGILDAKAKEKVYIKFDAHNQPVDVGLSAEASIGIKGMPPIASAGYTMGVNSGFNYHGSSMF